MRTAWTATRTAPAYCTDMRLRLGLGRYVMVEDRVHAQYGRAMHADDVDPALVGCDAVETAKAQPVRAADDIDPALVGCDALCAAGPRAADAAAGQP